ncbi:hypothetical protein PRBEI_2001602800 [Prionailurus iriomotensis]
MGVDCQSHRHPCVTQNKECSSELHKTLTIASASGNDLEALQIHRRILASDFTIEGQPSLEAPLITVTRKLLPQQTKRKEEETYNNKCHFLKKRLFSENIKGNLEMFRIEKKLCR